VKLLCLLLLASTLAAQPRRIVSTTPSITEILFALGLGDRVVGVTNFCRYPPEVARIPKIGTYVRPNLEAILSLRPDLVIIQENPIRLADQLTSVRLNVLEVEHFSAADIFSAIRKIGEAVGAPERARALNASIRGELEHIRRRTTPLPRRRVMFVVSRTAGTLEGLMVAGRASYLTELMDVSGGDNIFRDAPAPYPKVSLEEILARDPEVIIDMGDMADAAAVTEEHKRSVVALWSRYPFLTAVKRRAVFAVTGDVFVVPGPRMVDAAREFARMLHPEAVF